MLYFTIAMAHSKGNLESVESIKLENKVPPRSPRKYCKPLRCAILTKSPLKDCKTGKMFTMTLCDSDTSISTRAVCFLEDRFEKLEVKKTYDINKYKVKKGFGSDGLEIRIEDDTEIEESTTQFTMERSSFSIRQVVRGEAQNVKLINVKAKVITIHEVETVGKHPDTKVKRDVIICDETGQIEIVFWREMAECIDFEVNDVISIENVYASKFNQVFHLTCNSQTCIKKLDEEMEVVTGQPVAKDTPSVVTCIEEYIEAYKDFKCVIRCVNCQTETELTDKNKRLKTNGGYVVRCSTCSTTFLGTSVGAVNECKFLIADQWYIGRKAVSIVIEFKF